jgi:uncharacterized membrane protein
VTLSVATCVVILVAILTNRILAVGIGLWLRIPAALLLGVLIFIDFIQIPFFYRLYDHGFSLLDRMPAVRKMIQRDWSDSKLEKWALPFGGLGVMLLTAMPSFGGGIWSAAFLAYGLGLRRRAGYAWMMLGSVLSYLALYWVLDTLVKTVRYFTQ